MKRPLRLISGVVLLGGASLLAFPEEAIGYATFGQSLGITQRDMRVYNNFPGSGANNNTQQVANFPGYDGAELAIWKGGAEWNSRPHGDGSGDPLQSQLGDGNANFTFFWNGNASGVGTSNDNIVSSLGGSSGGVLAYCELPINNGWRIRFYGNAWNWQDGPSSIGSGQDIQGVACHELGHALGLDHSSVNGATMYPYASGTADRSIAGDDSNGVRAIYGGRDDNQMPRIDSVMGSLTPGSLITITGENFDPTGNRVWLNRDVLDSGFTGGEALKVSNVASTNGGTQLTFTLPQTGWEQGGAIHVQSSANDARSLSESHPFDATGPAIDTVTLSVSTNIPSVGQGVSVQVISAHPNGWYVVHWSRFNTGWVINGQPFGIGQPNGLIGIGQLNFIGNITFTKVVPPAAAGLTVYLEAQVDDTQGVTYDSNTVPVYIQ